MSESRQGLRPTVDFTRNGQCSRCGQCCSSVLPLGPDEWERLKKLVEEKKLRADVPSNGSDTVYVFCPFLDKAAKACRIYEDRPDVCRTFKCDLDPDTMARTWLAACGLNALPEDAMNMWGLFGKTGIKIGNTDVPYGMAPSAQLEMADGAVIRLYTGRPVRLLLADGRIIPPSLIVEIYNGGLVLFDQGLGRLNDVKFEDIAEVLTESCFVKKPSVP